METIRWVHTPPCRLCGAPAQLRRRPPCIGCEKFHQSQEKPVICVKHQQGKSQRQARDLKIAALHGQGQSYQKIAVLLGMPRATVQSAAKAGNRLLRAGARPARDFAQKAYECVRSAGRAPD